MPTVPQASIKPPLDYSMRHRHYKPEKNHFYTPIPHKESQRNKAAAEEMDRNNNNNNNNNNHSTLQERLVPITNFFDF